MTSNEVWPLSFVWSVKTILATGKWPGIPIKISQKIDYRRLCGKYFFINRNHIKIFSEDEANIKKNKK